MYADYLYGSHGSGDRDFDSGLQYYIGAGALLVLKDGYEADLGIRVPLGLDYVFAGGRFDLFAEVAPTLGVNIGFGLYGGVGIRYIF